MNKENNVKAVLFEYVKNPKTWFFWYHNPKRLEKLHDTDEDHKKYNCQKDYKKDREGFTKNDWRFEPKTVGTVDDYNVEIQKDLSDFFNAVLDEMRIKKANAFAEYALYISDNEDLAYFRDTVTKREIIADIDYNKQRDHAVHTLYNYILGWYIFEYSDKLQQAFRNYFENSNIDLNPSPEHLEFYRNYEKFCTIDTVEFERSIDFVNEFADVWHIASLLHDIGYILEGTLSSASSEVENARIINGSKIIHDYFNHWFWKIFEVDFRVAKNIAKTLGVVVPNFKNAESLSSLGDHLCDIGSCENIRRKLETQNEAFNDPAYQLMEAYGLNREAISIWKKYYQVYGNEKMQDILHVVEKVYRNNMWVGADHGKRNLDHGVCSGLIILQALTFFREIYWGFDKLEWDDFNEKQKKLERIDDEAKLIFCNFVSETMFKNIQDKVTHIPKRIRIIRGKFRSESWFKKVLWATASTAIHAIIQNDEYREECKKHIDKAKDEYKNQTYLRIGLDDPLAFLGILADVLQEWDRYTVTKQRGESAFSGAEPLQSIDVTLDRIYSDSTQSESVFSGTELLLQSTEIEVERIYSNRILLGYPKDGKDWTDELTKKLDKCLEDWGEIVEFLPR
ncbi:MAG: hypothetical protein EPN17_16340 [Methylobacter sp.]|nr:MAG: hypothetical protein EPN17_16340 [Methylobacter sp.]